MVSFFRYSLVFSLPRTFAKYVLKSTGTVLFCLMSWPPHLGGDVRYGPIVFLLFCWSPLFRFNLAQRRRRSQQPEPAQADLHVDDRAVLLAMPPFPPPPCQARTHGILERSGSRDALERADVENRHREKLVPRMPVVLDRRVVDGEKPERLRIEDPHRVGVGLEQQAVLLLGESRSTGRAEQCHSR